MPPLVPDFLLVRVEPVCTTWTARFNFLFHELASASLFSIFLFRASILRCSSWLSVCSLCSWLWSSWLFPDESLSARLPFYNPLWFAWRAFWSRRILLILIVILFKQSNFWGTISLLIPFPGVNYQVYISSYVFINSFESCEFVSKQRSKVVHQ